MKAHRRPRKRTLLRKTNPTFLLASWFLVLLAAGTALLALPAAHLPGVRVSVMTALFTATSAFCVTGLALVDTAASFSLFGQAVILVLMELGGVGIMSFAALAFSMVGRRLSLPERAVLTDTLFQDNPVLELHSIFRSMFKAVVLIQLAGVAVLYAAQPAAAVAGPGSPHPLWSAVFHSVSAFCNAGFAIYRDNMIPLADNRLFLSAIMILVVLGGLGFGVLAELYRLPRSLLAGEKRAHRLSANSRVVLLTTGLLLFAGALAMLLSDGMYGDGRTITWFDSLFHSVVSRTAGFNSAPLAAMPTLSCLVLYLLMFVGGSPGSCAGGVKTTSMAIWFAHTLSSLRLGGKVNLLGHTVSESLVNKSRIIISLSSVWVVAGTAFLLMLHPELPPRALLFEQISALATVGLSMGITSALDWPAQLWVIASMIMGKFGPLTIALWMVKPAKASVGRPDAHLMIG